MSRIVLFAGLALMLASQCGCESGRAVTPDGDAIIPQAQMTRLQTAASRGDWRAARRLATERFRIQEKQDGELLRLRRIWATGDQGGEMAVVHLLSRSCDAVQRQEAIGLARALLERPGIALDNLERGGLEYSLARAQGDGSDEDEGRDCLPLD
ncbi:MAG: hypothetical protein K0R83_1146 [Caulobacter sp.]|jgi:hypothetical protein|nr:hypothetical protein [Caulobacter sp.]